MGIDCGSQVVLCEYPIRLDTYEGCSHDCRYCFARMKRDISNVKPLHCAEQVRRFAAGNRTSTTSWCDWRIPLHWGGLSDPFQPAELEHRCTLEVLQVLKETQHPFIVSTKGRLVAEEPYLTLLSECDAVVQISMTSPLLDKLEVGAPTFAERIEMAARLAPRVKRVIARAQPYLPQCKASLIEALPAMKRAGIHGITIEGMKFKRRKPGLVKVGGDWAYPEEELERDYLAIRSRCRELGLAFWCAENRLRSLGDSTACCGCGDLPGFEGNRFNCVSIANGSGGGSVRADAAAGDGGLLQVAPPAGRGVRCDSAEELCRAYDGRGGCLLMPREAMRRKGTGAVLVRVPQCAGRYGALLRESPFCRAMMDFMR